VSEVFSADIVAARDSNRSLSGPWRRPTNLLIEQTYNSGASIHDDATAQKLGFRGGTIEGPTHFSQLAPLLYQLWGTAWFETGTISANYRSPSYEGEAVRAFAAPMGNEGADVAVKKEDGTVVLEGGASIGSGDYPSAVYSKLKRSVPLVSARILAGAQVGMRTSSRPVMMGFDDHFGALYPFTLRQKLQVITEPSSWYEEGALTPWGRPLMPVEMISVLCQHVALEDPFPVSQPVIGLFADQEIKILAGPLFPNEEYGLERELIALTETPRTECMWIRSRLTREGVVVAEATLNQAFLKASSPLYQDG
jgi:hypothetical protein